MALPLIVGGKTLGALDIQSSQESAFTQEDITTLKVLADQIAIAIENARLFSENQIALEMSAACLWQHQRGRVATLITGETGDSRICQFVRGPGCSCFRKCHSRLP